MSRKHENTKGNGGRRRRRAAGAGAKPERTDNADRQQYRASPKRHRTRLWTAAAIVILAAAVAAWRWFAATPQPLDGPIILVSIDTLRADHLPAYGYHEVDTPSIDALAREGIVFDHAYAQSPQTLPSHTCILSGELPFQTGVRDNVGFTVSPDTPLLQGLLGRRGFVSGGVVSAFVLRKETGIGRGFDFFDSRLPAAAPDQPMGEVQRSGAESLAVAEHWLDSVTSPRFFLFFHIYEPHKPYDPPERFSRYAPYDGEIAYSDEIVGRLFDYLKRRGWYDRSAIILLADHGEGLGDHGEQEHGLFLYNETIRVPLIIRLPEGAHGDRRIEVPVQHIDLVPTILDWLHIDRPPDLRGRSLVGLMDGTRRDLPETELYAEALFGRYHFGWSELYALTGSRYRYIRAPRPELYDLERDTGEVRNIAASQASTAAAMRGVLDRLLAGVAIEGQQKVSREDLQRLQALGYVGTQMPVPASTPADSLPDPKDKVAVLETYRRAVELAGRGDYEGSTRLMRAVLEDNPGMKDGWLQYGVQLVRAGRLDEALAAFKRLVELDPGDANSFVSVAGVLMTLGRVDEAKANAETGLEKAGSDTRATTSACEVLVKAALAKRDDPGARRYAQMAEKADPAFPLPAFVEGLILHRDRRFEEALPLFLQAARQLQGHAFAIPELYYYVGDTYANLGQEREAVTAFEEETRLFPAEIGARTHLAALLRAAGRKAEADRVLEGLLKASPTPEGYRSAAEAWAIFGDRARAEAVRAQAKQRFGNRVLQANRPGSTR